MYLQGHHFEIRHRSGEEHFDADAVSRILHSGDIDEALEAAEWTEPDDKEVTIKDLRNLHRLLKLQLSQLEQLPPKTDTQVVKKTWKKSAASHTILDTNIAVAEEYEVDEIPELIDLDEDDDDEDPRAGIYNTELEIEIPLRLISLRDDTKDPPADTRPTANPPRVEELDEFECALLPLTPDNSGNGYWEGTNMSVIRGHHETNMADATDIAEETDTQSPMSKGIREAQQKAREVRDSILDHQRSAEKVKAGDEETSPLEEAETSESDPDSQFNLSGAERPSTDKKILLQTGPYRWTPATMTEYINL
jgi:hypothetical protein